MVVTSAEPVPLGVATAALGYLIADGRVRRAHGRVPRPRARLAFFAGLGVVVAALTGPIDAAVTTSFSIHMFQHLLLTIVARDAILGDDNVIVVEHRVASRRFDAPFRCAPRNDHGFYAVTA